ncbi:Thioredoxin domain-containing protein 12 [Armadillidium vulgare]|nr:Thioredoxin domain-containing protein 12 [Armadillidium vulgare]
MIKYFSVTLVFISILVQNIFGLQDDSSENFTEILESLDISNGFGDSFSWNTLEVGLSKAENEGKPLMIIIHKVNCGACKAFKEKFSSSEHILKLSEYFIMVNIKEQDTEEEKFSPDGVYVLESYFLCFFFKFCVKKLTEPNKSGNVQLDIYNKNGNPEYKYFYHNMSHLLESMKKAISKLVTFSAYEEL